MVDSVSFLLQQPLNPRNYHRFGIDVLRQNGFKVRAFDFGPIVFPHVRPAPEIQSELATTIRSRKEATEAVASLARDGSFVVVLIGYTPASHWLFAELSKRRIAYAIAGLGAIPGYAETRSPIRRIGRLMSVPKAALVPVLFSRLVAAIRSTRITPASYCALGGTESVKQLDAPAQGAKAMWVHALDYDRFLEHRATARGCGDSSTAVFLDQYMPFHPDFAAAKTRSPVTPARYYESLRRYFDRIEESLGLRVTIAAHPKADYRDSPIIFGNRPIIVGDTIELVRRARLVLAHYSTAVNFAVLFRRPLLFLSTGELQTNGLSWQVHAVADCLGAPVIDIDAPDAPVPLVAPDEPSYARFVHSFITTRPDDSRYTWQIVADELKQM